jgi:phosphoserine phosphatase
VLDLERLGAAVLAGVLPRIYPEVLALAHEHQDAGRSVYITTAASQELADILAQVLVLDGGIGSQFSEAVDGVYTGRPTGLFIYGAGKASAIERLAEREGIDLAESYAYSDSASDLPMLRLVGHPVAVNPDRELLRVARQEGWGVLRCDRLGRKLKTVAGLAAAAAIGGVGSAALAARGRPRFTTRSLRGRDRAWHWAALRGR